MERSSSSVGQWLDSLRDAKTEAKIAARIARLAAGNFGDGKPLAEGVWELRRDRALAIEYLKAAMEDTEEPQVLLLALRHVAEARGGIAKVAKAAGIERESLYRALSPRANPRLSTLFAVTKAMRLTLTVETAQPPHR